MESIAPLLPLSLSMGHIRFRWGEIMASCTRDDRGHWRIRFYCNEGKRRTIRLGKVPKSLATSVAGYVQKLNAAKCSNTAPDPAVAIWTAELSPVLRKRLATAGLIQLQPEELEPEVADVPEVPVKVTLGEWVGRYLQSRPEVKPSTIAKLEAAGRHLLAFFGDDRELESIDSGSGDDFRAYLYRKGQSENTVRRYCGIGRQFFKAAIRRKLATENPFDEQKVSVQGNTERLYFLNREAYEKILRACPDTQWRMIVALCRIGGLRCPSEVLKLRWEDISWQESTITVHSPKTEHIPGKESRIIPLWDELAEVLNEGYETAFEALQTAGDGSSAAIVTGPVITRYRHATQNLRTTFLKIIKRAGLKPWPRLMQNMRSSRQTELSREEPASDVCHWMGNSLTVADRHYIQHGTSDCRAAVERSRSRRVAPNLAPQTRETGRVLSPAKEQSPKNTRFFGALRSSSQICNLPDGPNRTRTCDLSDVNRTL